MAPKLFAAACVCALAATRLASGGGGDSSGGVPWRSVTVNAALPFGVGVEHGHVSAATTVGGTRWSVRARWTSADGHSEVHVGLARKLAGS